MVSVILYPCIFCVALSIDLPVPCAACQTVSVNCLARQFALFLGVIVIFQSNAMEVLSVGGGVQLDRPCMVFRRMCLVCL